MKFGDYVKLSEKAKARHIYSERFNDRIAIVLKVTNTNLVKIVWHGNGTTDSLHSSFLKLTDGR